MKKGDIRKFTVLALCFSVVLLFMPMAGASAAEFNWTMEANLGITDPNDFHLACGEEYQGKQMIYSTNFFGLPVVLTGGSVLYSYDGVQFAQVGTPGFGDSNWTDIISELRLQGFKGSIDIEGWHDPVYRDDLEMTGQVHALNYLKNCRGGAEFAPNPQF